MKDLSQKYQREEESKKIIDCTLLFELLKYIEPYKLLIFVSLLLLILSKIAEAFVPLLIGYLSQNILNYAEANLFFSHHLLKEGLLVFGLLILAYFLDSINVWIRSYVGQKATLALRKDIYAHVQKLPMGFFDKNSIGRLLTRTIHDVDQIHEMFASSLVPLLGNAVLFICVFIGVTFINWKVGFGLLLLMPFVFIVTNNFRAYQRRCYDALRAVVAAMNGFVQENLMGIAIIRNFGREKEERKKFNEMNEDYCDIYLQNIKNFGFFVASIDFFQNITLIIAFVVLVIFAQPDKGFQAGDFFAFSLYALMIFRPLADLADRYNVLQAALAGASRVFRLLEVPSETLFDRGNLKLETISSVVFDEVWFAYEEPNYILRGLSFEIKQGESLALVGVTGAGKSTVMSLLLRFYSISQGKILINGFDIQNYSLESLRSAFSVVLQDPVLFSGTIAENIAIFEPLSFETIERAAQYVNLSSFLRSLPGGINHMLGERGSGLSAGEMQLVSLARAVAQNRSLFILDEATANIDSFTEKLIQEALRKMLQEKTSLVIAHRLSTIRDVSRIIVIGQGKVIEMGTHDELMKKSGIYEKLYKLQFSDV